MCGDVCVCIFFSFLFCSPRKERECIWVCVFRVSRRSFSKFMSLSAYLSVPGFLVSSSEPLSIFIYRVGLFFVSSFSSRALRLASPPVCMHLVSLLLFMTCVPLLEFS